ncbi:uncharacterized protein RJT20DRAFT_27116 [Scheffersomyces xylosifermentans]|uniref:uncharacterized protein n=1 Tax=Scheffersomyces xylosifermentans TaxID=1304137 RepID=UPI00315D2B7B
MKHDNSSKQLLSPLDAPQNIPSALQNIDLSHAIDTFQPGNHALDDIPRFVPLFDEKNGKIKRFVRTRTRKEKPKYRVVSMPIFSSSFSVDKQLPLPPVSAAPTSQPSEPESSFSTATHSPSSSIDVVKRSHKSRTISMYTGSNARYKFDSSEEEEVEDETSRSMEFVSPYVNTESTILFRNPYRLNQASATTQYDTVDSSHLHEPITERKRDTLDSYTLKNIIVDDDDDSLFSNGSNSTGTDRTSHHSINTDTASHIADSILNVVHGYSSPTESDTSSVYTRISEGSSSSDGPNVEIIQTSELSSFVDSLFSDVQVQLDSNDLNRATSNRRTISNPADLPRRATQAPEKLNDINNDTTLDLYEEQSLIEPLKLYKKIPPPPIAKDSYKLKDLIHEEEKRVTEKALPMPVQTLNIQKSRKKKTNNYNHEALNTAPSSKSLSSSNHSNDSASSGIGSLHETKHEFYEFVRQKPFDYCLDSKKQYNYSRFPSSTVPEKKRVQSASVVNDKKKANSTKVRFVSSSPSIKSLQGKPPQADISKRRVVSMLDVLDRIEEKPKEEQYSTMHSNMSSVTQIPPKESLEAFRQDKSLLPAVYRPVPHPTPANEYPASKDELIKKHISSFWLGMKQNKRITSGPPRRDNHMSKKLPQVLHGADRDNRFKRITSRR